MKFSIFILCLVVIVGLDYGFIVFDTVDHENTHQTIFRYYGVQSTVTYDFNPFDNHSLGQTSPTNDKNNTLCNSYCWLAHSNLEVQEHGTRMNAMLFFLGLLVAINFYYYYSFNKR